MTAAGGWSPPDTLVQDALRVFAAAPGDSPEARFEAVAWRALLRDTGPLLLTRDSAPAHVTASGVVLSPDARRTCLVLHRRLRQWVQPGGHLEPGDPAVLAAATREVLEETGLTARPAPLPAWLDRHRAPCRPGVVDWHLDVQFVLLAEPEEATVSEESLDVAWWPVDELPEPLAGGVHELVQRAVAAVSPR